MKDVVQQAITPEYASFCNDRITKKYDGRLTEDERYAFAKVSEALERLSLEDEVFAQDI